MIDAQPLDAARLRRPRALSPNCGTSTSRHVNLVGAVRQNMHKRLAPGGLFSIEVQLGIYPGAGPWRNKMERIEAA